MPTRYDRQLIEFSAEEQEKIRTTTVGIVGCGGLGSYVTTALALAGIGKMVIIDPDSPEITNLNRQFIYCKTVLNDAEPDRKARICSQWIKDLNPEVDVEYHIGRFDETTCGIFDECDIMVDCLDSISSRMFLNEYCVRTSKPLVHGGIGGFVGELCTIIPGKTPCLRCIMKDINDQKTPPASIGSIVMSIGSMEATEVIKLITGRGSESVGKFHSINFSSGNEISISFDRDPECPVCGKL